jgi:hypothetical protein
MQTLRGWQGVFLWLQHGSSGVRSRAAQSDHERYFSRHAKDYAQLSATPGQFSHLSLRQPGEDATQFFARFGWCICARRDRSKRA